MSTAFNLQAFIDGQPLRAVHFRVLALCALALFVDGFDVFVIGKVAPAIAAGFNVSSAAMTEVFLWQSIGLAFGAFAASPLADRYGRQRMIVVCTLAFGLLTVVSPFATTLTQLAVLRGLASLFLSGMMPMVVALVAETTPRARRGSFIALAMIGNSAGAAASGVIAVWFIDRWGWQSTFWISGALPLALVPFLLWLLPESLPYLVLRAKATQSILAKLQQQYPLAKLPADTQFAANRPAGTQTSTRLNELLGSQRRKLTLLMWWATGLSMGSIALLAAWLPTFFQEMQGVPIQKFAVLAMVAFSGGLAGTLSSGWLMDHLRASRLVPAIYAGLAISLIVLGQTRFGTATFIAVLIAYNFCQSAGQSMINMLLARIYPASIRSTGIGWAGGMGRVAGIVLPLFGGIALHGHLSLPLTLGLIAIVPALVAVTLWRLPVTGTD